MNPFFYFKQAERQGILFLLILIAAAFIFPKVYVHYWKVDAFFEINLSILDTVSTAPITQYEKEKPYQKDPIVRSDTVFFFDPNQVTGSQLAQLGLSKRAASTLINFRNKGGHFYKKTDLLKIYGLEESWYAAIVDYVQIANSNPSYSAANTYTNNYEQPKYPKAPEIPVTVEVNQSTAEEWAKLKGIGPVLSSRIVKFREKLGGFYTLEQVQQTYGLADSTFQEIKDQLILEVQIQPFRINELSTKELASHPYLGWKEAQIISSYRSMHGPFQDSLALNKVRALDPEKIKRIRPYLDFCAPCD
ncbi:MAG: helix-hairpin-helix domain-containing protein [Saprospiraceae bacterium]